MISNWKYLYCDFPLYLSDIILMSGIYPRKLTGGDVVRVYPSRREADSAVKGRMGRVLFRIDAERLNSDFLEQIDNNYMFYRGPIPASAILRIENGHRSSTLYKKGRKL